MIKLLEKTFKALIFGLGQIGMNYDIDLDNKKYVFSYASALYEHKGFKIVGAVDKNNKVKKNFYKSKKMILRNKLYNNFS